MKDQNPVSDGETKTEKMNRAYDLYIESIHKPDTVLRACAHTVSYTHLTLPTKA